MLANIKDAHLKPQVNIMTVDVEEYFQVGAFEKVIRPDQWSTFNGRAAARTERLLDIFAEHNVKATFFVLGWVAERHPDLIRRMVSEGHEVASHGCNHQRVTDLSPAEFFDDIYRSKVLLEDICGQEVSGYRAPSFSIVKSSEWAFEQLHNAGYQYSSSTYPINHDHYGTAEWPKEPYRTLEGLLEIPQSTVEIGGRRLPAGGGGFFRLFPQLLNRHLINTFHQQSQHPYVFYFHPWEMDPEQPRIKASLKSRFRHYVNQRHMESKIEDLCKKYEWVSMQQAFKLAKSTV